MREKENTETLNRLYLQLSRVCVCVCVCVCQVYWVGKKVNRAIRKQEHVETSVIEEKEKSKQV